MDQWARRTKVEWREWGEAAFAEAADAGKPVLLSLSASWCSWCHEMDETTYSRPTIAANVNERFVPIRVDVDRHPRVRERYNVGGFPSTVFATPDGVPLTGATFLDPDGMRQVLERVRQRWDREGADAGRLPRALRETETPAGEVTPAIEAHVAGQLDDKFDEVHGGWGDDAKFPLARTVEFALKREREQALATLTAIREYLFDEDGGGFYRYAGARDWSEPHREKLLAPNAALVRAYAHAYLYTGDDDYREPAAETVDYLTSTLWTDVEPRSTETASGRSPRAGAAFGGSQAPVEDGSTTGRDGADAPIDGTAYADGNALAADALLTYAAYTDDERARRYAERALSFVREELVDDGVVTHYVDGEEAGERGLLADQARVASAFARAAQVLGGGHLDTARAAADRALETLADGGAFVDGPADGPGMLDRPLRPLDGNAEMADALVDLHALTGEERYREAARGAVAAFAGAADRMGVQVANYATAAARVERDPLVVAVATPPGTDLHRAALRVADHEKVVVPNAAGEAFDEGRAYVVVGDRVSDPAASPAELGERVAALSTTDRGDD